MANLQDLETAERALTAAVEDALGDYFAVIHAGVFSDPEHPNWVGWPAGAWAQIYTEKVLPVLGEEFARQLRSEGVTDEGVIRAYTASFITQMSFLADDPHVPARVLEEVSRAAAQPEGAQQIAGLLTVGAVVWAGMIAVAASNAAALAVNSAVFSAARSESARGRRVLKTWRAVDDSRTRASHAAADNTSVPVEDVFTVGGFPLRFPHDPFGPPQEIMNCRCVLSFEVK